MEARVPEERLKAKAKGSPVLVPVILLPQILLLAAQVLGSHPPLHQA
jgi:hypothetical protein